MVNNFIILLYFYVLKDKILWFYLTQITINCGYFATIIHKKVRDCFYLSSQSLPLCTIDPYKIYGLEVVEAYDFSYNYKLI